MMRRLARFGYLALARALRFEDRLLRRIERDGLAVVLSIHRVSPDRNDFYPPLHPRALDELLTFLEARFALSTFASQGTAKTRGRPLAILSFDDGFHDFVEHAMPVLARHGIAANQNVIVSSVITGTPPWTQRVNDFLAAAPGRLLAELRLPGFERVLPREDGYERARYGAALTGFLTARSREARAPLLAELERVMSKIDFPATRMMDLRDVREAAREHEIGAHSYEHDVMEFESLDFFRADLEKCDAFFRDVLGHPLTIYAFPNGAYRSDQVALLRERGVATILLVGDRYARPYGPVYPRFNLGTRDRDALRLEALGARARPLPL